MIGLFLASLAFTPDGMVQARRAAHALDRRPLVEGCGCPCCTRYDRAFLRQMFVAREQFGGRLLALHNLRFLLDLMRDARAALAAGTFDGWSAE